MSAPAYEEAPYYKDLVHNLGYKPLVMAFAYVESYSIRGWKQLPISYYRRYVDEEFGVIIEGKSLFYEHLDDNTIRFYGEGGTEVIVFLFLEPRKDAWYE